VLEVGFDDLVMALGGSREGDPAKYRVNVVSVSGTGRDAGATTASSWRRPASAPIPS